MKLGGLDDKRVSEVSGILTLDDLEGDTGLEWVGYAADVPFKSQMPKHTVHVAVKLWRVVDSRIGHQKAFCLSEGGSHELLQKVVVGTLNFQSLSAFSPRIPRSFTPARVGGGG